MEKEIPVTATIRYGTARVLGEDEGPIRGSNPYMILGLMKAGVFDENGTKPIDYNGIRGLESRESLRDCYIDLGLVVSKPLSSSGQEDADLENLLKELDEKDIRVDGEEVLLPYHFLELKDKPEMVIGIATNLRVDDTFGKDFRGHGLRPEKGGLARAIYHPAINKVSLWTDMQRSDKRGRIVEVSPFYEG